MLRSADAASQALRIFAVDRPGRECALVSTWDRSARAGQGGIVSCFAFNPDCSGMFAAGSYDRCAALYDVRTREQLALLHGGHAGGVTHARFSPDGNYLYTGARRDDHIACWDIRATAGVVYRLRRAGEGTNQRIGFDIEPSGRHLASGGSDGVVRVFDLTDGSQAASFQAAPDTVGWTEYHPFAPLAATASGHRRLQCVDDDDAVAVQDDAAANALRIWRWR